MKYFSHIIFLILLITTLVLCACNNSEQQEEKYKIMILKVSPHKDFFIGGGAVTDMLGYVVTDSTNNTYVIDYIHDFADIYEIGYEYVIKVKAVDQNQSGELTMDLVGYYYYLIEVISKEKRE